MDIENSDELTTHIKKDTITLQKRLDEKKKKYQRQPNRKGNDKSHQEKKNETQPTKNKHRSTWRTKEKEENQKPMPSPHRN